MGHVVAQGGSVGDRNAEEGDLLTAIYLFVIK